MVHGHILTIRLTLTTRKMDTFLASLGRQLPLALATRSGAGSRVDDFGAETSTGAEGRSISTVAPRLRIGSTTPSTPAASHTIIRTRGTGQPATQNGAGAS